MTTTNHYNNNPNDDDDDNNVSKTNARALKQTLLKLNIPPNHLSAQNRNGVSIVIDNNNKNPVKTPSKPKRRDKSDLGDDFVAPDGDWGWLVSISAGVNMLVTFAIAQQFGIIYREHMFNLGITNSELTTIINIQIAVSAFTGLLNGPLFRRFSYRQVAFFGSFLIFVGLFFSVFATTFSLYVCTYSCCYGFGRGLSVSAASLAVNTYYKQKRRTATAYQFGVAGLGPIVLPYFATYLLQFFGVQGTVLIFSGISLHSFACSLIFQPVKWHIKKMDGTTSAAATYQQQQQQQQQQCQAVDEMEQIAEPDTPILPRANDGWYGSRVSLNSNSYRNRATNWDKQGNMPMQELRRLNSRDNSMTSRNLRHLSMSHSIVEETHDERLEHQHGNNGDHVADEEEHNVKVALQRAQAAANESAEAREFEALEEAERQKLPFLRKLAIFFDLGLLRNITYVNLALGLTLINFVEVNFAILTPFILSDFGFDNNQIAMAMSILGFFDLVIRFLIPSITANLNFSNKSFFVFGIIGMCVGRMLLSLTRNFYIMIGIFIWLGLNKAFRTVFWSLIIPGYVPLRRLPAAAGLQLLMSGIFSMVFGPLIGLIRDRTNYAFTLNFLNGLCFLAILMWTVEAVLRRKKSLQLESK